MGHVGCSPVRTPQYGACLFHSSMSVGLCLAYTVPCVSDTSLQNCYLRLLPVLYICSHISLSVTLVALPIKLYLVFLFCFFK